MHPILVYYFFIPQVCCSLSLWNAHSWASVDTAFSLAFMSLSSGRRTLLLTLNLTRGPLECFQHGSNAGRVSEGCLIVCYKSCGGPTVQDGEGRSGRKQRHNHPPPPLSYCISQSLHLSPLSLSSHPVFVRHILPKISSTVSCQRDVLATISRV